MEKFAVDKSSDSAALALSLKTSKLKLLQLKIQHKQGQLKDVSQIRKLKRGIAEIYTYINSKKVKTNA